MNKLSIFVVDDESIVRVTLSDDLKDLGYKVFEYDNPLVALVDLQKFEPDIIFTDIKMPELNGIELLTKIKDINPDIYVIMMTGFGSIDSAVQSVKAGAYDYLNKPLNFENIKILLNQIEKLESIKKNYDTIISQSSENYSFQSIVGKSQAKQELIESIKIVSNTNSTVLIQGETGTGKELVSNVIHYNSLRKDKPFIKVSCAILSKEIFESELFGHIKGAFTGAIKEKKGRFELADKGTLYLDDIDDIPIELQVKLLRVLEQGEFEKVGGEETIRTDVRIIASTKKDLKKLASEGNFREDLYYRLNVFPIYLKPLRERKEDIPELFCFFLNNIIAKDKISVSKEVYEILENYDFPGNTRELKHLAERLFLISSGSEITPQHLPYEIKDTIKSSESFDFGTQSLDEYLSSLEKNILLQTLQKTEGNKSKAAEILKLPYSTLRTKLDKHNI